MEQSLNGQIQSVEKEFRKGLLKNFDYSYTIAGIFDAFCLLPVILSMVTAKKGA